MTFLFGCLRAFLYGFYLHSFLVMIAIRIFFEI